MTTQTLADHLLVERRDSVAIITLNRPTSLNSLSHLLLIDLRETIVDLNEDPSVRAIVLTGAGRAFCAGADLGGAPSDAEDTVRRLYNPLVLTLTEISTPVVAAVNGLAAGAGFSIALACDLRVVAESASFQLSFVRIGLVPDAGATWFLTRAVGATRANEIALLARKVRASEALAWGLVNEVIGDDEVLTRAVAVAEELAALTASVGATKQLLLEAGDRDLAGQLDAEATAQGVAQHSEDFVRIREEFRRKAATRNA